MLSCIQVSTSADPEGQVLLFSWVILLVSGWLASSRRWRAVDTMLFLDCLAALGWAGSSKHCVS